MPDYKKMYITLFNAITYAEELIRQGKYRSAEEKLIQAQRDTEEMFISAEEEST